MGKTLVSDLFPSLVNAPRQFLLLLSYGLNTDVLFTHEPCWFVSYVFVRTRFGLEGEIIPFRPFHPYYTFGLIRRTTKSDLYLTGLMELYQEIYDFTPEGWENYLCKLLFYLFSSSKF